jgi:hypothetical protein
MFVRFLSIFALTVACAIASAAGAASTEAGTSAAAAAGRPFVLYDAIGDAVGVADITSVAVARDAKNRVTFAINVAGHPAMKRGELFQVGIDADRSLATGSDGRDVALMLAWPAGEASPSYAVGRWDGSSWQPLDVAADARYSSSGPRFTVAMDDLGLGRAFRFDAGAGRIAAPHKDAVEWAPSKGLASARLVATASIAEIGRMLIPGTMLFPEAGKVFRVRGIELSADDNRVDVAPGIGGSVAVRPDRVRCTAKIGSIELRPVGSCAWRVPSTARGKTLMLKVSVAYRGDEVTDVYPLEVG